VVPQDSDAARRELPGAGAHAVPFAPRARADISPPPDSPPLQILLEKAFHREQVFHDALDVLALTVFKACAQTVEAESLLPNEVSDVALLVELQGGPS
jgi:hypothetical protein